MKKHRFLILISFLFAIVISVAAQGVKVVKVVDSSTGCIMKSVSVKHGNGDMTMTNSEGLFTISQEQGDSVTLSCVGYLKESAVVRDSLSIIRMIPSMKLLPELTVNPWNITMKAILKEQARQMKKGKKLRGNYLYRQSTSVDGRMTSIIEAFFEGRNVASLRDLKIITGRYSELDMYHGKFTHSANFFPLSQMQLFNPAMKVKELDRVLPLFADYERYYNVDYELIDFDGRSVYKMDFLPKNPETKQEIFVGQLYIDSKSYSLLAAEGEIRNIIVVQNYSSVNEKYVYCNARCSLRYDDSSGYSQVQSVYITAEYDNIRFNSVLYNVGKRKVKREKTAKPLRDLRHQIDAVGQDNTFWKENEIILRTQGETDLLNRKGSAYVPSPANDAIDKLGIEICNNPQIQEKIYMHIDNQSYYVGDTLWWKAYVVSADDLKPTDISRVLYVELLTPDGFVTERQQVLLGGDGTAFGQFELKDSLYSGYYELRAYTKWNLNFNVTERKHYSVNRYVFYNKQFEKDYFRQFEGLYSRVIPIYEKPEKAGDYADKRIIPRPTQRVYVDKPDLIVNFYPEGGRLVEGIRSRIAFEIKDMDGLAVDVEGMLENDSLIHATHQGRGYFYYTPDKKNRDVKFNWQTKNYTFKLPKAEKQGCVMEYDVKSSSMRIEGNVPLGAISVSCRGRVTHFERVGKDVRQTILNLQKLNLPTGINDIVAYDTLAQPLASRLVFINNNDIGKYLEVDMPKEAAKYDSISLRINNTDFFSTALKRVSVSVRDANDDDQTFDNGNIMTDLLLSGDLKGFVAYPAYYFASDDMEHRCNLDLLMMVQGWRKYKRAEQLRYKPEQYMMYEGRVLKVLDNLETEIPMGVRNYIGSGHVLYVKEGLLTHEDPHHSDVRVDSEGNKPDFIDDTDSFIKGGIGHVLNGKEGILPPDDPYHTDKRVDSEGIRPDFIDDTDSDIKDQYESDIDGFDAAFYDVPELDLDLTDNIQVSKKAKKMLRKEKKQILVEAELVVDDKVSGIVLKPDEQGRFRFRIPNYYDYGVLFITAYQEKDSLKKSLTSGKSRLVTPRYYPDYYIKREMFFPQYCEPYSWYQTHQPDVLDFTDEENADNVDTNTHLEGDHMLQNVYVRKRRRSKHALVYSKPAIFRDAYDLYNEATDMGLCYGTFSMLSFSLQAACSQMGYLDLPNNFLYTGVINEAPFIKNYATTIPEVKRTIRPDEANDLSLSRIQSVALYSDYDKRKGIHLERDGKADVTVNYLTIPDNGRRYVYRDRRYVWPGLNYAEEFYSPDYSKQKPEEPKDYRRTLYWNPNAQLNDDGSFTVTLYGNSRETRLKASACGLSADGQVYYNR